MSGPKSINLDMFYCKSKSFEMNHQKHVGDQDFILDGWEGCLYTVIPCLFQLEVVPFWGWGFVALK